MCANNIQSSFPGWGNYFGFPNGDPASQPNQQTTQYQPGFSYFNCGQSSFQTSQSQTPQSQTPQSLYDDPEIAQWMNGNSDGQLSPQSAKRDAGSAAIIEVDGKNDEHAQAVQDVYRQNNPNGKQEFISLNGDSESQAVTGKEKTGDSADDAPKNKAELDALIDAGATDSFDAFGKQIDDVVKNGKASVINGSLGYSRDDIYTDTLSALQGNPDLAGELGLKPDDIKNLETDKDGTTLITPEVAQGITKYVDGRLDAESSAYQKAKANYQDITDNAAKNGVTVVVAAGNEHDLDSVFERNSPGGDTNFLAQSNSVISVAASDDHGTKSLRDDTIADFSSYGDGQFNPTVAASGVNVKTPSGSQDGTSFAAPKVAATIAQLQKENPNLTFDQIKMLLQGTAYDTQAPAEAEGAGILNQNALLRAGQQGYPLAS